MPRFTAAADAANRALLTQFQAVAAGLGITPAQLALAWVLSRGEHVLAIPGTTQIAHLHDNLGAAEVVLPPAAVARVDALFAPGAVTGGRYSAASQAEVDTEQFA